MHLLKVSLGKFINESRNMREMDTAIEAGFEVSVLCDASKEGGAVNELEGYSIKRITLIDRAKPLPLMLVNAVPRLFRWINHVRQLKPDVISCHDLIPLAIAYLAQLSLPYNNKPVLIYDSHELELERAPNDRRRPWMKKLLYQLEKYLIKKVEAVLVVSESISAHLVKQYRLKNLPVVVRNIPPYWTVDATLCFKVRNKYFGKLNLPANGAVMIYWGLIAPGRGIERLIEVVSVTDEIGLVLMGPADQYYLDTIKASAEVLRVSSKIYYQEAVPAEKIWQYSGAADVAMITIPNISMSYFYMLPNKLFESIQSLTPIVASEFPEVKKIIDDYNVGIAVNPDDINGIAVAVKKICFDKEFSGALKLNLIKAKEELCWEKEKVKLLAIYKSLVCKLEQD